MGKYSFKRFILNIWHNQSVLFALILLLIIGTIISPVFLTARNLSNILRQVSVIGILSLGMTMVIITGGIDLSVGSVLALTGVFAVTMVNMTGSVVLAILLTIMLGAAIGMINGLLITKGRIAPFIATLGMMAAARSLALFSIHGGAITSKVPGFMTLTSITVLGLRLPVYYFIILSVLVYLLMNKRKFGRYVYSIGSNERASLLSAIDVNNVKLLVYILAGTLTGISAVIEASTLNSISSASSGYSYELDAIACVIIGGTSLDGGKGTIVGTVIGVLLLGILNNLLNIMNMSPFLQGFVKGVIIIVAVLLQKKQD